MQVAESIGMKFSGGQKPVFSNSKKVTTNEDSKYGGLGGGGEDHRTVIDTRKTSFNQSSTSNSAN